MNADNKLQITDLQKNIENNAIDNVLDWLGRYYNSADHFGELEMSKITKELFKIVTDEKYLMLDKIIKKFNYVEGLIIQDLAISEFDEFIAKLDQKILKHMSDNNENFMDGYLTMIVEYSEGQIEQYYYSKHLFTDYFWNDILNLKGYQIIVKNTILPIQKFINALN